MGPKARANMARPYANTAFRERLAIEAERGCDNLLNKKFAKKVGQRKDGTEYSVTFPVGDKCPHPALVSWTEPGTGKVVRWCYDCMTGGDDDAAEAGEEA